MSMETDVQYWTMIFINDVTDIYHLFIFIKAQIVLDTDSTTYILAAWLVNASKQKVSLTPSRLVLASRRGFYFHLSPSLTEVR